MRITFLFLLIVLAVPSYSQFNISLSAGLDLPINDIGNDNFDFLGMYWNSGITAVLSGEIFVSRVVAISPSVEYAYYGFDHYTFIGGSIPEVHFKSATGEASKVWRMFAETKFFPNTHKAVQWYLSNGIGIVIERIGTIEATWEYMGGGSFIRTVQYQGKNFFF